VDGDKKNTLLIVDDENSNLKVISHILGSNYTIYTATDGMNAIKKAKELKPDLILLDIIMPVMDGYTTLSELKKNVETYKIPVVFITGLNNMEDEVKGLSLDAADYITKPFSAAIVKLRVQNQMKIVNQMRTIERLSMIDHLTNIPNKRSFDERISMEWKQAMREQTPISLLMMDLDKFKTLNDTYGHQKGDFILHSVAQVFSQSLRRPGDFVARWGGEEFTVLLPNTPLEGAVESAERIRLGTEKNDYVSDDGMVLKITVSIGVHSLMRVTDNSMHAIETFISNTDDALYSAKKAGRNRVMVYQSEKK